MRHDGANLIRPATLVDLVAVNAIYVAPSDQGLDHGRQPYAALLAELTTRDMHLVLAAVALPNPASLALHRRYGFEQVGTIREVGNKHDRWIDVTWSQNRLS